MSDAAYRAPTPRILYVHDDLSAQVDRTHGPGSRAARLARALLHAVQRDPHRVIVLTLEDQIVRLVAQGAPAPFSIAVAIGQAGERVASELHARTGWFPTVRRVDLTREEDGRGGYAVVTVGSESLKDSLRDLAAQRSLAVVDDTVFSGLTLRTVLGALPAAVLPRTRAFCLRGVAETVSSLAARCPVSVGFAAPGRILDDVSFINASGLVTRGSIRRAGLPPLAFFERSEWMEAWFPGYATEVIALCQALNGLLEARAAPE
jgi:hypothetical protein